MIYLVKSCEESSDDDILWNPDDISEEMIFLVKNPVMI